MFITVLSWCSASYKVFITVLSWCSASYKVNVSLSLDYLAFCTGFFTLKVLPVTAGVMLHLRGHVTQVGLQLTSIPLDKKPSKRARGFKNDT